MAAELIGQKAELTFTIEVKRLNTGETETYEMVGVINNEEISDVRNSQHGSTERSD
jgi:hypothetical protein